MTLIGYLANMSVFLLDYYNCTATGSSITLYCLPMITFDGVFSKSGGVSFLLIPLQFHISLLMPAD
jgi:hypothetical protein